MNITVNPLTEETTVEKCSDFKPNPKDTTLHRQHKSSADETHKKENTEKNEELTISGSRNQRAVQQVEGGRYCDDGKRVEMVSRHTNTTYSAAVLDYDPISSDITHKSSSDDPSIKSDSAEDEAEWIDEDLSTIVHYGDSPCSNKTNPLSVDKQLSEDSLANKECAI